MGPHEGAEPAEQPPRRRPAVARRGRPPRQPGAGPATGGSPPSVSGSVAGSRAGPERPGSRGTTTSRAGAKPTSGPSTHHEPKSASTTSSRSSPGPATRRARCTAAVRSSRAVAPSGWSAVRSPWWVHSSSRTIRFTACRSGAQAADESVRRSIAGPRPSSRDSRSRTRGSETYDACTSRASRCGSSSTATRSSVSADHGPRSVTTRSGTDDASTASTTATTSAVALPGAVEDHLHVGHGVLPADRRPLDPAVRDPVGQEGEVVVVDLGLPPHHVRGAEVPAAGLPVGHEHRAALREPVAEGRVLAELEVDVHAPGLEVQRPEERRGGPHVGAVGAGTGLPQVVGAGVQLLHPGVSLALLAGEVVRHRAGRHRVADRGGVDAVERRRVDEPLVPQHDGVVQQVVPAQLGRDVVGLDEHVAVQPVQHLALGGHRPGVAGGRATPPVRRAHHPGALGPDLGQRGRAARARRRRRPPRAGGRGRSGRPGRRARTAGCARRGRSGSPRSPGGSASTRPSAGTASDPQSLRRTRA